MRKPETDGRLAARAYRLDDMSTGEGNIIEGHAAVYGEKTVIGGQFYEIVERSAFDGCDLSDVLFFCNHDTQKLPLARSRRKGGRATMEIRPDDVGLYMRAEVDREQNAEASALYSAIERGDIDGMSFLFHVADETWTGFDEELPTRHITRIDKVYEVSAVNWPAYETTSISARSRTLESDAAAVETARSAYMQARAATERQRQRINIKLKMED